MARDLPLLPITDLVPFERGCVSSRLDIAKRLLRRNKNYLKEMPAVEVVEIDGAYVVANGTHRVRAALDMGYTVVPVTLLYKNEQDIRPYRDALREHASLKGFYTLPVCRNEDERQSLPPPSF